MRDLSLDKISQAINKVFTESKLQVPLTFEINVRIQNNDILKDSFSFLIYQRERDLSGNLISHIIFSDDIGKFQQELKRSITSKNS
ncbi:hypothetical protein [Flavobacterium denitrificans]|uniref:hypothetical protein n=1 Tax=Flavobacterium denitrificans TaxID=281361 RepID=UPI0004013943|nr:hypothetical protein [Flavobacterium denitrificans]